MNSPEPFISSLTASITIIIIIIIAEKETNSQYVQSIIIRTPITSVPYPQ